MAETFLDGKIHETLAVDCNTYGDYGIFSMDRDGKGQMIIRMSVTEIVELRASIDEFLVGLRDNLSAVVAK